LKDLSLLALEIAKVYLQFHKKYSFKTFSLTKVKETKWWPYFLKCASNFGNRDEWDTYKFIEAQFHIADGDVFPFSLMKEECWDNFLMFKKRDKDFPVYIANNILASYNSIKEWSRLKGYETPNYKEYFSDKTIRGNIERHSVSFYLLSILRGFYEYYYNRLTDEQKDSLIKIEDLMAMRAAVYTNEKIKKKMQEVLGTEFV
jgi:hypothetical protein